MKIKSDIVDHILALLIVFFLALCVKVIVTTAKAQAAMPVQPTPVTMIGPEIQQCNKELWLRIKDGCP